MKKFFLVTLLFLFTISFVFADIAIGDGVETNKALPIEAFYGYTYSQVIYLQTDINGDGDITELTWDFAGTTLANSSDWTIYMGHTTQAQFDTNTSWIDVSTLTEVWTGTFADPGAPGLLTFDITDFTYNNVDNLVIAVDENTPDYDTSSSDFYCTEVTTPRGLEYHNDSTNPDPAAPPAGGYGNPRSFIANIILGGITTNSPVGIIAGTVTDGTDPIEGAIISAGAFSATSAADGTYEIVDVYVGNYDVSCAAEDYTTAYLNIDVTEGNTTTADFALEPFMGDSCEDAIVIGEVVDYPFDTTTATASGFGSFISSPDLWYVYTATGEGMLKVDICGSAFDTKLAAWGECDDTTLIASNDDACYGERALQSELDEFPIVTGEDYFIQVGGYSSNVGTGDLTIVFTPNTTTVDYQVRLYDSYGDGWDSASIDLAVNGTVVLDDITLATGYGPEAFIFAVADGDDVDITYTAGTYPGENTYDIVNEEDVVIYTSPAPPEASYSFTVGAAVAPNVFFSEYIEGSSNNKALEIYNGTEETIDLANFQINQSSNGGGWEYIHTFPEGATLAAGDVWVIAADQLDPAYYPEALCDEFLAYPSVVHYNGNDARALEYFTNGEWMAIDIIGNPDEEIYWPVAGVDPGTQNHTIVRKDAITTGNTDWLASAGTNADDSEWIVYDENTFDYLGWHLVQPAYIDGTVTIDAFGDVTDTEIAIGEDVITYPGEDGYYIVDVAPGTYDVIATMPGYDVLTTSGVVCVAGEVSTVDFALTVIPETLWPPVNLTAEIDASNVNVAWTAPTQYGWNSYYDGPASLTWAAPERSVLFDVTDFGFSYPMELSQLSHAFYEHPSYPWGDDTTFTFKIYDADGITVLYESAVITALTQWDETLLTLETPLTVTDNFYVAVVPTGASGFPSSLFDSDTENLHGYVGEAGAWGEPYADFATLVYIVGEDGTELLTYSAVRKDMAKPTTSSRAPKRIDSVKIDGRVPNDNSRDLLSYNVFRDAVQLNEEPVYDVAYVDLDVPAGEHTYYATALWNYGESGASNTATVNLAFGNLSGIVTDGTDPIEGAIINAGEYSTVTVADGTYLIEGMLAGTYEVNCSALNYVNADPVTVEIIAGETTVLDFVLEPASGEIVFFDDFEGGADNWTFEGTWGLSEEGSYSPTHCMTESPDANYAPNLNIASTLATPWDLSAALGAELSFWYKSDIETAFDYMYLEISTDGAEWVNLATYDEEDGEWQETTIPIGGFVGVGYETVSIRFHFVSDGGYETVGFLIDDVKLTVFNDDIFPPFIAHTGPEFYEGTPDDYVFDATIIDISGVAEANVIYTVDEGDPITLPFTSVAGDVYTFTIPAQEAGAQVDYAIEAFDAAPEPNTGLLEGFVYIAGTPFIYDNGVVDFYTVFAEGDGAAELITNPAGNQLNLAYALIRNYTDQSGQDNDPFEFHVWTSVDGLPGEDLITPFVVVPEATYSNTSAMTRVDLRPYAAELENIQGNFFIGFLVNQQGPEGHVHCTISQPANYEGHSFASIAGAWQLYNPASDLHFRAVAELITVSTGTVEGVVTSDGTTPIEGAVVTVGTASATTIADGTYSIIADPGEQDVTCVADGYVDFVGSVEVIGNDTVVYDIEMEMILWAPQNAAAVQNGAHVMVTWDVPAPPVAGEVLEEGFEVWPPDGWMFVDEDGDGYQWDDGGDLGLIGHTGDGLAYSASYLNPPGPGALTPDDWLISPQVVLGENSTVNYWVQAQDAAWAGEHYGVFVSTTGTAIADFELVFEETMVAEGRSGNPNNKIVKGNSDTPGTWYERTLDLSAFTGPVYVAFRHFDCTDMFYLNLDDVTIGETATRSRALAGYNVYRDGTQLNTPTVTSLFYLDLNVPGGEYIYNVTAVYEDPDGESEFSNDAALFIEDAGNILPLVTELEGNYPNPFNPTTTINFSLKTAEKTLLEIYNIRGEKVRTLVDGELQADYHSIVWNGTDNSGKKSASGVYFYKMKAGSYQQTKKMILMK